MWGVTKRVAVAYGYTGPMKLLPRDTAMQIAKRVYWNPLHLDLFEPRIAFQMFDANYNGGHPVLWAQASAGAKADGIMGKETIAKLQAVNVFQFQMRFLALRLLYLASLGIWPTFGRGWARRIATNLMIGGA